MSVPSGPELLLRWWQIFMAIAFPVVIVTIALLAWLDFHRWVNYQIESREESRRLEDEVKEFIE